ncbi:DNA-directed RNA polymerase subunit E' [Encephalitozoon hellem ATCC 50504]|uniref:DNA-directed RNA polymerase subunit n=1 Tax=Encephalitozoon hellem TaxID=27973 RepID=A0A9Q9C4X0_ENCHE|nr:DNA-directed RNA polymerase subunit E' [Encephalitozoon hellem ATCC 50504]AFM98763.1 DNA-directed RNA polymerase subunit E' [Encephalitozoon hellem ATCC 50504]UTX43740.1 RNA polymerase III subunit Rpc25 [Encephalitozoon hellem]WEL39217.1 DNA-directed RNA polymerase subunit [Encephalitozoon hellem]|eukprot:XP_003887744.1 DNA-directed RNA polymerase subunit E' [Encephalitozoon hellem ATCC 50504]
MFYSVEIEDRIKISLENGLEKEKEVFEKLKRKYVGRILEDGSICIVVMSIVNVCEYKVYDEFLLAKVEFEALLFKFFEYEVVCGTILEQKEDGMRLCVPFFSDLFVKRSGLPDVTERAYVSDCGEKQLAWVWMYRGNKLYFRRNAYVRFRVLGSEEKSPFVLCDLGEAGLGPLEWWI